MGVYAMLKTVVTVLALAGSLCAQTEFYLKSEDRVLVLQNELNGAPVDLAFLETAVQTRYPRHSIRFIPPAEQSAGKDATAMLNMARRERATVVVWISGPASQDPSTVSFSRTAFRLARTLPSIRFAAVDLLPVPSSSIVDKPVPQNLNIFSLEHGGATNGVAAAFDLLRKWGMAPVVTSVDLDCITKNAVVVNTAVRDVQVNQVVAWTQDDQALPLPLEPLMKSGIPAFVASTVDVQGLRVTRLPAAAYGLTIDGDRIGQFTREQLESGLNLAFFHTPMTRQSARVHDLIMEYDPKNVSGSAEVSNQDGNRGEEELPVYIQAAQPKTHDYELHPLAFR